MRGGNVLGVPDRLDPHRRSCSLYEGIEYQDYWKGLGKHRLDELERVLVNELLPVSGRRFIDVGCGFGRLADCYLDRFREVVLFDGSMSLLRQAREKIGGRAVYIAGDVNCLPFQPGTFDAALMVRVFHHLAEPRACLRNLCRTLCHQGQFIFNYANKRNPRQVAIWLLDRRASDPLSLEPTGAGTPFIAYHPRFVQQLLDDMGFSIVTSRGAGVLDKLADVLGPLGRWVPLGTGLAPLLGQTQLAPWIWLSCRTTIAQSVPQPEEARVDDLLQCPQCARRLAGEMQSYYCPACERRYPLVDGIIDLRIE